MADYLTCFDEVIDTSAPVRYVDPQKYWEDRSFTGCTFKPLQVKVVEKGEIIYDCPTADEIRSYVHQQRSGEIWEEEQRFENPHTHYLDMSPAMFETKMGLLYAHGKAGK